MDRTFRLFRRLSEAVAGGSGTGDRTGDRTGLTIGDIYQQLVPYRLVRTELGFSELKEYEHALLRLLAGEGGWVAVAQAEAAEEFQRELASPNPILGIYRDYAGVGVTLNDLTDPLPMMRPPAETLAAEPPIVRPAAPVEPLPSPPRAQAPAAPSACARCHAALPAGRAVRFCPFCGAGQVRVPCTQCRAALEPGWSFCADCGAGRAQG